MTKMEIIEGLCTNGNNIEQQGVFSGDMLELDAVFGEGVRIAVGFYEKKKQYFYSYNEQFRGKYGIPRADVLLEDASEKKNIIFLYKIED